MLPPGAANLHILVVDDVAQTRLLLRGVLRNLGFVHVTETTSVEEAVEAILVSVPDIVITDWEMPERSGMELLTWLRRDPRSPAPGLPVILLTAHGDPERVRACRDAGATDFLVKPIAPKRILERVLDLMRRQRSFVVSPGYVGPDRRRARRPVVHDRRAPTPPQEVAVLPPDGVLEARMSGDATLLEEALLRREQARVMVGVRARVATEPEAPEEMVFALAGTALAALERAAETLQAMQGALSAWHGSSSAPLLPSAERVLASLRALPACARPDQSEPALIRLHLLAVRAIIRSLDDPEAAALAEALAARIDVVRQERTQE